MGSYKLENTGDTLSAYCEGSFTPEDAKQYYTDFMAEVKKVNPATCKLFLDGSKLAVSKSDSAKVLSAIMELYQKTGFKKVTMHLSDNAILKMQVTMLAKKAGFDFQLV